MAHFFNKFGILNMTLSNYLDLDGYLHLRKII